MKTVQQKLLKHLIHHNDWIEGRILADVFSVTARTISSYIKEINQTYEQPLVLSSYKGYRWNSDMDAMRNEFWKNEVQSYHRIPNIIMKLITHSNMNVFDLAEELYISDSLLHMELRKAADQIKEFDLIIKREKNMLNIIGTEENKRKVIAMLLREESISNLSNLLQSNPFQTEYLSNSQTSDLLLQPLNDSLRQEEHIRFNDFGIHNILIHILVMTDRIIANRVLPDNKNMITMQQTDEYQLAMRLKTILEETLHIHVPKTELNYLTLVISSNAVLVNPVIVCDENVKDYIPAYYIQLGTSLVAALEKNYFLPPFSNDFILKFTIHIMNLVNRMKQGIALHNVYTEKTKEDYPLIYDMALYIVKKLSKECQIQIQEDEVTYLVYHIGSYLLMKQSNEKINVCIVYLNYNDFHMNALAALKLRYDNVMNIMIVPLSDFYTITKEAFDLMITLGDFQLKTDTLLLNFRMIPTARDFRILDSVIHEIHTTRRRKKLKDSLSHFIKKELFDLDIYAENELQLIRILTNRCIALHLCDSQFQQGVIERELLSSTAILNGIAVPHSLEHVCNQSFIYIVINSKNTPWGDQMVRVIIMIGTSMDDSDSFKEIFDNLIKVLYDEHSLPKLQKVRRYDEFINILVELMITHTDED